MDIFNKQKIAELEGDVNSLKYSNEAYKLRNEQLEKCEAELKSAKFKIEVMQMLIDDDEAILELLAAKKVKKAEEVKAPLSSVDTDRIYLNALSGMQGMGAASQQAMMMRNHALSNQLNGIGYAGAGFAGIGLAAAALF